MSILEGTGTGKGGMGPSADDDDAHRVTYELTCSDFPDDLEVRTFDAIEELNRPYVVAVQAELRSEVTELGELLGRDAVVRLHRRDHERSFAGIVGRTRVDATGHWGPIGTIEIVPALWALRFTEQSRIFQEKTALEIVELILNESLGGMEVVVSFVDGDPDRPLVTGCVYNGANPTPGMLPVQATKSIIRTRTVPHGPGHNELSFEDAMGMERVHIRAQRDLDELVLHDHITDVRGARSSSVARDQYSRIGGQLNVEVRGESNLNVVGGDIRTSLSDFVHRVGGSAETVVGSSYHLEVLGGTYTLEVDDGECITRSKGPIVLEHDETHFVQLSSEEGEEGVLARSGESLLHVSEQKIELKIGRSSIVMTEDMIQINGKTFPAAGGSD